MKTIGRLRKVVRTVRSGSLRVGGGCVGGNFLGRRNASSALANYTNFAARVLENGCEHHQARPAFITSEGSDITYEDLLENVSRLTNLLKKLGVKKGDRIMVLAQKDPLVIQIYLATMSIGAIFLPLNPAYTNQELQYFLDDSEPALAISCIEEVKRLKEVCAQNKGSRVLNFEQIKNSMDACVYNLSLENVDLGEIAAICYTSGTTGKPKGAMITHQNLSSNAHDLSKVWGFSHSDVLIHPLPIYHVHGLFVATNTALLSCSSMYFLETSDSTRIVDLLPKATSMMGVPTHYTRLLQHEGLTKEACKNIRLFVSGSAPLHKDTHHDFFQRTGHTIVERYGMTEAQIITSNPIDGNIKVGSVGLPLPSTDIRVVDNYGHEVDDSSIGVVEIKGENVFLGYWKKPDKTIEEFRSDGYFISGDLAYRDEDGYLFIVGREKDLIISGGLNVYPKEIESQIDDIPGIRESAVIGIPHRDWGEAVVALIVQEEENTTIHEREVTDRLKNDLASYKVPKRVFTVPELPRNSMGKVQKNELREQYKDIFADQ